MDPITQGVLGAALPLSLSKQKKFTTTAWLACLAGMAPDLDVFIRSSNDPMLFLEYHRQFTHSLVFIPLGALLCCLLTFHWSKHTLKFKQSYTVCMLAYGTHALLDACTTYGTQLFWPFSDLRVAWNNISVVDPAVTLPLLICVVFSIRKHQPLYARLGFAWVITYLLFGVFQNQRAVSAGMDLAHSRGHSPEQISARPGFANLILWKVIYEWDDKYYVDAVRMGFKLKTYQGDSVQKLLVQRDLPWLDPDSQQAEDLRRFEWFSKGYLAIDQLDPLLVIDMRYSILPNEINALWAIRLDPDASIKQHITYVTNRDVSPARRSTLWRMLQGEDNEGV